MADAAATSIPDPNDVRTLWKSLGTRATAAVLRDRINARGAVARGTLTKNMLRGFATGRNELDAKVLQEAHAALLDIQRERETLGLAEAESERTGNVVPFPSSADKPKTAGAGGEDCTGGVGGEATGDNAELSAEYARLARENTASGPPLDGGLEDLRTRAAALAEGDIAGARPIIEAAARLGVDECERDHLISEINKALGKRIRVGSIRALWDRAERRAQIDRTITGEQRAAAAAARVAEISRLAPLVEHLAKDPAILDRVIDAVAAAGVVGERRATLAVYLTATSRLNRRRCLSVLRRGAASSGKNFLIEIVLTLMPPESIFTVSGGSPKALIYSGESVEDVDALKHKLIYLPEAAATLAVKNGVESDFTAMARTLISEGYIRYHTVVGQNGRPPTGLEIVRNGPIAVVVTSARDDIEDELMTRLFLADSDESLTQSSKVLASLLDTAAGSPPAPPLSAGEIEQFRDFQRWLELGGPYDVVLPFGPAIRLAFTLTPATTPHAVRIRRDIGGLIAAVSASAILHKAQRQTDGKERIVATLDDYRHAYEAFAPGVAALYRGRAKTPRIFANNRAERNFSRFFRFQAV
jgi:hypothetical protein